ncbi:DUF4012 domain-containing protein, partial [Candidatus Microgenomates bacterium]|nr:DUF4012 domain-containing protein [Candidatus Microgenomates bacterium]
VGLAETRGKMDGPSGSLTEIAVSKLIRAAFSTRITGRQILVGRETSSNNKSYPTEKLSIQDVFNKINSVKKRKVIKPKKVFSKIVLSIAFLLIFLSLFLLALPSIRAVYNIKIARDSLMSGNFKQAEEFADRSKRDFASTKKVALSLGPISESYFDLLLLGETSADVLSRVSRIAPKANLLAKNLSNGEKAEVGPLIEVIHKELGPINEDLALIEAQAKNLNIKHKYILEIPSIRQMLTKVDEVLVVLPEIFPKTGKRTYLLVFQNSAELRPSGGFIGSYGLLNIDNGKLSSWEIQDVYTADGQLKGYVPPPDELLHFFNQQSWYLRDSNWSPDFPLTAKRIIWFFEKETGQQVDGVIAVNLGAAQKIIKAIGPLNLTDLNQTVSGEDFFQKAEYSSEINFFAGSTQKKDFLGSTARA